MDVLIYLIFVLLMVAVVGHGIWLAVAWLLRGGRSRSHRVEYEPTLTDDRAATARYLEHLQSRGLIDEETRSRLMRQIADDAKRVHSLEAYQVLKDDHASAETRDRDEERRKASPPDSPELIPAPPSFTPPDREAEVKAAPPTVPSPPAEPELPPAEPRRTLSEVLASFMAEKNIRWGELVGGLLIVCSSTALVISLWSQIEAIPVLKFVIFTAVTAALSGAGLFVFHRWNLPTTGHALLVIATLLVPLNLLAFAAFAPPRALGGGPTVVAELLAIGLFAWLMLLAGRIVMPDTPKLFAGGVVGLSASSLVIRFVSPSTIPATLGTSLLPVGPYIMVMAATLLRHSRIGRVHDKTARALILQLGVQTFACLAPLGLLLYGSGHVTAAFHILAPMVCALAVPALITGLFLWRQAGSAVSAPVRTTAASIAMVAAAVMLIGVGLAWPIPARLLPALLVNALAMVGLSRLIRHPAVHATASVWFAAAWVLGVQLVSGGLSWSASAPGVVMAALLSARTGQALVAAAATCAFIAIRLDRRQRRVLSLGYGFTSLAFAVISVALVTRFGFGVAGDAEHVTWVYAVYAAASFAAARRLRTIFAAWCGCILIQMAIVQVLVYVWPLRYFAWPTALLVGASACTAAAVLFKWRRVQPDVAQRYVGPMAMFAVSISLLAVIGMTVTLSSETLAVFAIRMAWVSVLWIVLAFMNRWPVVLAGSQAALVVAACAGVQQYLRSLPWYQAMSSPLRDPWVWQAHLLVIGGLCLAWAIVRAMIHWRWVRASVSRDAAEPQTLSQNGWLGVTLRLLNPRIPATDRWMAAVVLLALVLLSIWSVLPGIVAEHGWQSSSIVVGPHTHAAGIGSWILLGMAVATFILWLPEGFHGVEILGILVAAGCGTALLAASFEAQHQVVSAWRWLLASAVLVTSIAVWARGQWLDKVVRLLGLSTGSGAVSAGDIRLCIFALFALPCVLLTVTFTLAVGRGDAPLAGALSDAWLRFLLLGPPVLVAVSLIGFGMNERQPGYAVATAGLACAAVTGTELCMLGRAGAWVSPALAVWLVQLNALVSSAVTIAWHAARSKDKHADDATRYPTWPLDVARAVIGAALLLAVAALWLQPRSVSAAVVQAGSIWGLLAVVLVEWSRLTASRLPWRTWEGRRASVWVLFGVVLLACALAPLDTGNWLCFHALMIGFLAAGWLRLYAGDRQVRQLLGSGWQETFDTASAKTDGSIGQIDHDLSCVDCSYNLRGLASTGRCPECNTAIAESLESAINRLTPKWTAQLTRARVQTAASVLVCTALSTLYALRAAVDDPQRPWWSSPVMAALSGLCMALAAWTPRRVFAYVGGIEICLAASAAWLTFASFGDDLSNLANVNVIALAAAGMAWLFVERRFLLRRSTARVAGRWPAFHHTAAVLSAGVVTALAGVAFYGAAIQQPIGQMPSLSWLAWGVATALMLACGKPPAFGRVPAGLYVLGLAAMGLIMAHGNMASRTLAFAVSLALAGYVLATTVVSRYRVKVDRDSPAPSAVGAWLRHANGVATAVSVLLSLYVNGSHPEIAVRMVVVVSPWLCAAAMLMAAGHRRAVAQTCSLALLAIGGVLFACSWVPPDASSGILHRAIGLVAAISVMTLASSAAATRLDPKGTWMTAVRRNLAGMSAIAGVALLYCVGFEINALMNGQSVPLVGAAITAMIVALALMVVACIAFAVRHRLDPLRLPASAKGAYVYLAELLAAVLALHVRATMPWLFSGVITQYWPMLVMALAFTAMAVGEVCERQAVRVFARPLGRTGVFLPVLALLELFLASSRVHYSIVLLTIGALYAVLAGLRRSMVMGGLAALSITGSLWYLLQTTPGLGIAQHPQLWFIPPSLAVFVAGHLNRNRLGIQRRKALNYACLIAIYLSSTADIFLIGVAQAPWLPPILAGLSVAGILAGIALRVRSFLQMGTGFLCLSLLTMIWHAAANLGWTWVWYVAGIVLGLTIITVFALFEKKRSEMSVVLEKVRDWAE